MGGKFAATAHSEPSVSLDVSGPPAAASILSANTDPATLTYVAYDEKQVAVEIVNVEDCARAIQSRSAGFARGPCGHPGRPRYWLIVSELA